MQFVAQVMLGDLGPDDWRGVLSVFMCQNDPGMCDEGDPAAGGNQALRGMTTVPPRISAAVAADTGSSAVHAARQPFSGSDAHSPRRTA